MRPIWPALTRVDWKETDAGRCAGAGWHQLHRNVVGELSKYSNGGGGGNPGARALQGTLNKLQN